MRVCEHVKIKQDAGVVQQALHTVRTEDIRAHARAQMLHPLRPTFDTNEEGFCVLPDDGGRGGGGSCRGAVREKVMLAAP